MKRLVHVLSCLFVVLACLSTVRAYADTGDTYVVQPGDTLTQIAARHGLTATQLATANGLSWNAWVYAGQRLSIPGAATSSRAAAPASTGGTYLVRGGDTLTGIAARHGVTIRQLEAANGLKRNAWIYAGQRLKIPGQAAVTAAAAAAVAPAAAPVASTGNYVVRPGDTLLRIAMRHDITAQRLAMANGMHANAWVYIGQRLKIPGQAPSDPASTGAASPAPAAGGTYVVRPGDTLIGIAIRHGISANQLATANGLRSGAWVYVGQKLKILTSRSSSAADPEPATRQPADTQPAVAQTSDPQAADPQSADPQSADPQSVGPQSEGPQPTGPKWIDVDLTTQTLTAYIGESAVFTAVVSTGRSATPTVEGTYRVYSKYVSTHMSGPGYSLPNVPHVMFFYRGYSIHGTYWHNNFGTPMSHGCVNMTRADAKWLYNWTPMGTKVVTHF